jgi:hypothetical protein
MSEAFPFTDFPGERIGGNASPFPLKIRKGLSIVTALFNQEITVYES